MKNKLIDDETRKTIIKDTGKPVDELRGSGRSVGMALFFIGKAMMNPGKRITIYDHWYEDIIESGLVMERIIHYFLDKLGLMYFRTYREGTTIYLVYEVFE